MNINYTSDLNKQLLKLSSSVEIINNSLSFVFSKSYLNQIMTLLKDAYNNKDEIEMLVKFDDLNLSYLDDCDFDYKIDAIHDDLIESDKETFLISFEPSYIHANLNSMLIGNPSEVFKKLCLFFCYSTKFVNKENDHVRELISLSKETGAKILEENDIIELLNNKELFENDMRVAFNKYVLLYQKKLKLMKDIEKEMDDIFRKE